MRNLLRSCQYCGRIHPVGYACPHKPRPKKKGTEAERIRSSYAWQKTRQRVQARDHFLCAYCLSHGRLTYERLEVHHIHPLEERPDLAFEEDSLITLCERHHEQAERGTIRREELLELAEHPPWGSREKIEHLFAPTAPI